MRTGKTRPEFGADGLWVRPLRPRTSVRNLPRRHRCRNNCLYILGLWRNIGWLLGPNCQRTAKSRRHKLPRKTATFGSLLAVCESDMGFIGG